MKKSNQSVLSTTVFEYFELSVPDLILINEKLDSEFGRSRFYKYSDHARS